MNILYLTGLIKHVNKIENLTPITFLQILNNYPVKFFVKERYTKPLGFVSSNSDDLTFTIKSRTSQIHVAIVCQKFKFSGKDIN